MCKLPELPRFARHDPMLCGARGLFRSLARGTRDQALEIQHQHGMSNVHLSSPVSFGCDDLRILQAVMALASTSQLAIRSDCVTDARALRTSLQLTSSAEHMDALLIKTSYARLTRIAGYSSGRGGAMMEQVRGSLQRLGRCEMSVFKDAQKFGWRLLSWDEFGEGRDQLRIALNPGSSRCAHGNDRFTLLNMDEIRRLERDATRLCYQRLSTFVDAAPRIRLSGYCKTARVSCKILEEYAWGCNVLQASSAARRQRRATLLEVLKELRQVGWRVKQVSPDLYELSRADRNSAGTRHVEPIASSNSISS